MTDIPPLPPGRIDALDGIRAIAILMVAGFHYLSRFPGFYPYGDRFGGLSGYGHLGVDLFFIISGFVITLTLTRSAGPFDFAVSRFARLFPAMLVCSVITFVVMTLSDTGFADARRVGLSGFLPSLTFTSPAYWQLLGIDANWIDGAYWSLFIELQFYVMAAFIAFMLGPQKFSRTFVGFALLAYAFYFATRALHFDIAAKLAAHVFFVRYLYLFVAGVAFLDIFQRKTGAQTWVALALALAMTPLFQQDIFATGIVAGFFAMFALLSWRRGNIPILCVRPLVAIGLVSYPFYLLHQNLGVGVITLVRPDLPDWAYLVLVPCVVAGVLMLALLVNKGVETPTRRAIRARWRKWSGSA